MSWPDILCRGRLLPQFEAVKSKKIRWQNSDLPLQSLFCSEGPLLYGKVLAQQSSAVVAAKAIDHFSKFRPTLLFFFSSLSPLSLALHYRSFSSIRFQYYICYSRNLCGTFPKKPKVTSQKIHIVWRSTAKKSHTLIILCARSAQPPAGLTNMRRRCRFRLLRVLKNETFFSDFPTLWKSVPRVTVPRQTYEFLIFTIYYSPWTEYHRLPNSGWVLVRIVVVRWTWHYGIPLWSARENNSRKRGLSIPPTEWPSTKTSTVEGKREDNNKIRYIVQLEWRGHTVKVRFIVVVKLHLYGRQGKVSLISCQKIWEVFFLQGLKK